MHTFIRLSSICSIIIIIGWKTKRTVGVTAINSCMHYKVLCWTSYSVLVVASRRPLQGWRLLQQLLRPLLLLHLHIWEEVIGLPESHGYLFITPCVLCHYVMNEVLGMPELIVDYTIIVEYMDMYTKSLLKQQNRFNLSEKVNSTRIHPTLCNDYFRCRHVPS